MDPGGHGIFDFVHRDPARYIPISSATPPVTDPGSSIEIAGYYFPIGGETPANNRGGTPFWDLLRDAGVETEIYRIPGNYPPTPSDASVLSGMGTVDMRGGYGTYTWITDQPVGKRGDQNLAAFEHALHFQAHELIVPFAERGGGCFSLTFHELVNSPTQVAVQYPYEPPRLHESHARRLVSCAQQAP
jgi:hypothetical protein